MGESISVVIPYFNDSISIRRCIDSIISQIMKPQELIIIDDASGDSDELKKILCQYASKIKIIYKRNSINMNGAFSRNLGIELASSQYIALIDADDYWGKEHISRSLSFLKENDSDFVYSNVIEEVNGYYFQREVSDINQIKNKCDIFFLSPPQTNSFFFKKSIYPRLMFDVDLRRHQDYQFLLSAIILDIKLIYCNIYTSYYCSSPRPLSDRMNYDSVFYFWNKNRTLFTSSLLNKKLLMFLFGCYKTLPYSDIQGFIEKYDVLRAPQLKKTLLYKGISKKNSNKRVNLFFVSFLYHIQFNKIGAAMKVYHFLRRGIKIKSSYKSLH